MQVTRQRIIDLLKRQGQATVEDLAEVVDLTPMAVRHHLNVLQAEGLIEVVRTKRQKSPGRPKQLFSLTEKAKKYHPQEYVQLTNLLIAELDNRLDKEEITDIFNSMADHLAVQAPLPAKNQSFEDRLDQIISFLQERGYPAEWVIENGEYVIHNLDCPYRQVAQSHPEVCAMDKKMVGMLLDVTPNRTSCIAKNDDKCSYVVSKTPNKSNQPIKLT